MAYGRSMAVDEEIIRFEYDDRAAVVAALDELSAQGDGEGWINIRPALTEEQEISVPVRSGLAAWFSGRGEPVAMATWTPAASSWTRHCSVSTSPASPDFTAAPTKQRLTSYGERAGVPCP